MTDPAPAQGPAATEAADDAASPQTAGKPEKKEESFVVFLVKLVLIVVIFRSFVFSPFNIPSESMLPRLLNGDYLLASKWSYGFSRYSFPFSLPLIPGRILASQPERGDIAIFKAPPRNDTDYIKRVIGLPGDQIQVKNGVLFINGKQVPKRRVEDFVVHQSANTSCYRAEFEGKLEDGTPVCRYPQFHETLPNGVGYNVLDFGAVDRGGMLGIDADNTPPILVPEGHLFMMGDNRDNSLDSRFPAVPGGGVGLVPQANLVGKASVMMFSTDGSSEWFKPWTWFTAARWSRIGGLL